MNREYVDIHNRKYDKFFWSFGKCKLKPPWYATAKPSEWQNNNNDNNNKSTIKIWRGHGE